MSTNAVFFLLLIPHTLACGANTPPLPDTSTEESSLEPNIFQTWNAWTVSSNSVLPWNWRDRYKQALLEYNEGQPLPALQETKGKPLLCFLPIMEGVCKKHEIPEWAGKRWWYDDATDTCIEFVYSGCGGNRNNFETFDLCRSSCRLEWKSGCDPNSHIYIEDPPIVD